MVALFFIFIMVFSYSHAMVENRLPVRRPIAY